LRHHPDCGWKRNKEKGAEIYFEFRTFGIDLLAKGIGKISDLGSIIHSTVKIKKHSVQESDQEIPNCENTGAKLRDFVILLLR